jgi:hypothetical protein
MVREADSRHTPPLDGPAANKRQADRFARTVAPVIRELRAKGIVAKSAIARALNQRRIPTARRGKWHRTSVVRLLNRLPRSQVTITELASALAVARAVALAFGDFT